MNTLNDFEIQLLKKVANYYPSLKTHIPHLVVSSREKTGIGMYINFEYSGNADIEPLGLGDDELGINEHIEMDGVKYGLCFVIAVSDRYVEYIEIVTCDGAPWDGIIKSYHFV